MDRIRAPPAMTPGRDWSANKSRDIRWTEAGLILLIATVVPTAIYGLLWFYRSLGSVGIIGFVGLALSILGTLFIVLGRKSFGPKHSGYAVVSISISAVFSLLLFTGAFGFSYPALPAWTIEIVLTAVPGIATVLLTYGLQGNWGRFLLWAAYSASLVWSATLVYEGWKGPLGLLAGPISIFLTLAPSGVFAAAFYLALYRLRKGVIPGILFAGGAYGKLVSG